MAKLIKETVIKKYGLEDGITFETIKRDGGVEEFRHVYSPRANTHYENKDLHKRVIKIIEEINLTNEENKFIY